MKPWQLAIRWAWKKRGQSPFVRSTLQAVPAGTDGHRAQHGRLVGDCPLFFRWWFAIVGLALLATSGCRTDPAIPILERELRIKDDEIYRLRGRLEDMQDSAECQRRPLGGASPAGEPEILAPRRSTTSVAPAEVQPPTIQMPSHPGTTVPDTLKVPAVPEHLRAPSKPIVPGGSNGGPTSSRSSADGPTLESDGRRSRPAAISMASQAAAAVPFTPSGDSRRVASVTLDRSMTGGIGADDAAGDQGLLVVIEPRDRAGRDVDAPGDVSVVVLDPAINGDGSRIARWDFPAAETASLFRRAGRSQAIHLAMTWPGDPPKHGKLHLYVRYVTADGRKLNLDQPIEVALAGDKTARWTPSDSGGRVERTSFESPQSWRVSETPRTPEPMPAPPVVARAEEPKLQRPAWSPNR